MKLTIKFYEKLGGPIVATFTFLPTATLGQVQRAIESHPDCHLTYKFSL